MTTRIQLYILTSLFALIAAAPVAILSNLVF
jgi:hypothetical protein